MTERGPCLAENRGENEMVLIPAGSFCMGTLSSAVPALMQRFGVRHPDILLPETPAHTVGLDAFYMDRGPVTNAQFQGFLESKPEWQSANLPPDVQNGMYLEGWDGTTFPEGKGDHPVVYVTWHAALAYARWCGKHLPTEAQWEYAARGGLAGAQFPWGDEMPDPTLANYAASGIGETTPVGQYPPNGYGLCDMAGNVWEFCLDAWNECFYARSPRHNPLAGGRPSSVGEALAITSRRVIRGGSWAGAPVNLRVAYRDSHPPTGAGSHVGFRCVRPA